MMGVVERARWSSIKGGEHPTFELGEKKRGSGIERGLEGESQLGSKRLFKEGMLVRFAWQVRKERAAASSKTAGPPELPATSWGRLWEQL
jgi:hypothetical protein